MANRRMLSKSISYSKQVQALSEFAQLLFTWTIPHLDDFGRIDGDPAVLRAIVIPMKNKSEQEVESAIQEMIIHELVDRYEVDKGMILQFLKFEDHQQGLNKRTNSKYPDKSINSEKIQEIPRTSSLTEDNQTELKRIKANLIKKSSEEENIKIAGEKINTKPLLINPLTFIPESNGDSEALKAWKTLESDKPWTFQNTYLAAHKKGLPDHLFGQLTSEILQDPKVRNRGAVFNSKIDNYFKKKNDNKKS